MSSMTLSPMHPSAVYYSSPRHSHAGLRRCFPDPPLQNPWATHDFSWDTDSRRGRLAAMYDLPTAAKPLDASPILPFVSLFTRGDEVHDPQVAPVRQLSPIGSGRHRQLQGAPTVSRRASSVPASTRVPAPQTATQVAPVKRAPSGGRVSSQAPLPLSLPSPWRPNSTPPVLYQTPPRPLPVVPQQAAAATPPPPPAPAPAPAPVSLPPLSVSSFLAFEDPPSVHTRAECANDPLCVVHRKRPARPTGPHKRGHLALYHARPQFGAQTCADKECLSRSCVDCAHLNSRGGALGVKLTRRAVEARFTGKDGIRPVYIENFGRLLEMRERLMAPLNAEKKL
ncbi:hypothetical protein C8Q79DRAFT_1007833 [Trametes meyenii]|nr:hypothetical protein C8Q79DRAFT_1007833 [Trametes meyenii]